MNEFIKIVTFIWLLFCALFVWVVVALAGLLLSFTDLSFMYDITPFIGLFSFVCIIKCAIDVLLKSNPVNYINTKMEWLLGKAKI